jgi:hypothetical protein
MTTVIIDTKSNEAKRLVEYLRTIKYVKVVDNQTEGSNYYNPDFVKMIKQREKQPSVNLDVDDLWK